MDEADITAAREESLAAALAKNKMPEMDMSNPGGKCWNCGEPTSQSQRWCDSMCRDDWQTREEARHH